MRANRRNVMRMIGLAFGLGLAAGLPGGALALEQDAARAHVRTAVDELLEIARSSAGTAEKADRFQAVMERRAAIPQIARFAAGRVWRDLDEDQQDRYVDGFAHYVSHIYAGRFQEYSGQQVEIGAVRDQGDRGLLVQSQVVGGGQAPVNVEWLISDRPGRPVVADIIIEGVSMLITQREEVAGIYAQRGNDPERLIDYLSSVGAHQEPVTSGSSNLP